MRILVLGADGYLGRPTAVYGQRTEQTNRDPVLAKRAAAQSAP
jgi:hypothetical protein